MQYKIYKPRPELLLHPNIPKPLHSVNPRSIMGKEAWDKKRKEVYASTGHHCAACGVSRYEAKLHKWLEAHEIYDIDYVKGRVTLIEIVPLCHYCHSYIHSGYLDVRYSKGEISREHYQAIYVHGGRLTNGMQRKNIPLLGIPWGEWRLVFEGKEYPPIYDSYEAWYIHFYGEPPRNSYTDYDWDDDEDPEFGFNFFGD